jgi:hypothetical protein
MRADGKAYSTSICGPGPDGLWTGKLAVRLGGGFSGVNGAIA